MLTIKCIIKVIWEKREKHVFLPEEYFYIVQ